MSIRLAVVMRKERINNPWQTHQWVLDEVLLDVGQFPGVSSAGGYSSSFPVINLDEIQGRCVFNDDSNQESEQRWLFTGFELDLFVDEAEGYYLNVESPTPCWFVMWRLEELEGFDELHAVPRRVVLSYHEAGRMSDGGETVDLYPLDATILEYLKEFVTHNYKPEPKRKQRPVSFEGAHRPAWKDGQKGGGHG